MKNFQIRRFPKLNKHITHPTRATRHPLFRRQKSTTTTTDTLGIAASGTSTSTVRNDATTSHQTQMDPNPEAIPHHDESHAGPYGVEAPPDWSFVVTVTEVVVEIKPSEVAGGGIGIVKGKEGEV
jgi:carbohydrate-binding DOMON domain-containing protein